MAALTEKEVRDALSQDAFTRPIAEDRNRNPAWFQAVMIGVRMGEKHALEEAARICEAEEKELRDNWPTTGGPAIVGVERCIRALRRQ